MTPWAAASRSAPCSARSSASIRDRPGAAPTGCPPTTRSWSATAPAPDLGLRAAQPWRFSFDAATGDLWIGDVGQNAYEEVDVEPAGSGGRSATAGTGARGRHPFNGGDRPDEGVDPVIEYGRDDGCTVIGGFSSRPAHRRAARCLPVRRLLLRLGAGGPDPRRRGAGAARPRPWVPSLSSFGTDAAGELYALSLAGVVYRLAPA